MPNVLLDSSSVCGKEKASKNLVKVGIRGHVSRIFGESAR